jgi:hypothetical protein
MMKKADLSSGTLRIVGGGARTVEAKLDRP